jgi:hypothetical protein
MELTNVLWPGDKRRPYIRYKNSIDAFVAGFFTARLHA